MLEDELASVTFKKILLPFFSHPKNKSAPLHPWHCGVLHHFHVGSMCEVFVASDHIHGIRSRKQRLFFFFSGENDLPLAVDSTGVSGRSGSLNCSCKLRREI